LVAVLPSIPGMFRVHKLPHLVLYHIHLVEDEDMYVAAVVAEQIGSQSAAKLEGHVQLAQEARLGPGAYRYPAEPLAMARRAT
jgi:hypothetical protein